MNKNWCYYLLPVVLMLAIPFQTAADDFLRGDCNQDGNVSIADVTCLIDYLLSQQWPEDQPSEPENVTFVLNGIEINMVRVEGGTFTMGASGADLEAWCGGNASSKTHPVATKIPNELGLYDMSGNVYEWCNDRYGSYYATDGQINPQGPDTGDYRVTRGGCFLHNASQCRVSWRKKRQQTGYIDYYQGLRLAMSYPN